MKIGVFDSGVGGLSVANALEIAFPEHTVQFKNDVTHVPYGNRNSEEIYGFVVPILQSMVEDGCEIIVVACNTVSTTLITRLRQVLIVPLVAIEPMVKPAAHSTQTNKIIVCATPTTLASPRYAELKKSYAKGVTIFEPDCSSWATMIEDNQFNEAAIGENIEPLLHEGADVIVLACTHYHWIETQMLTLAGDRAKILQPETAIVREVKRVIERLK